MQLFELFGDIVIRDNDADQRLERIDTKAAKADGVLGKLSGIAGKVGIGLAAVGVAAVGAATAIGVTAFNAAEDLQKSLNGLQAATGSTDEAMKDMKASMLEIYKNNFGESFEDIGQSLTTIAQQTGLTGKALTDITQDAIAMRDTFEFEVNESVRSANMLMNQFGMTGKEAYNLIAQGAQKGLNKNDDLLDTINEYSVQFKSLGFNAEEMFNMLSNGAAGGTWSVDKLGDAIKEFGIRAKDESTTTMDAFKGLGLNANQISKDFAAGGESGKKAFDTVTKKLLEMKDPLAQNQIGVALFGTMWEDLGAKGIAALANTNGEINKTVDALGKINQVKYNTFGEALEGIKRQLEVGMIIPLGERILPKLSELSGWINANMPAIQQVITDTFSGIGTAMDFVTVNILPPLQTLFMELAQTAMPVLKTAFDIFTTQVIPAWISIFQSLAQNVLPVVIDIFKYITEKIMPPFIEVFKFIYTEVVPKLAQAYQQWIPIIGNIIQNLWDVIKPVMDNILTAFQTTWPTIKSIVNTTIESVTKIISGLLKALNGVITFIKGTFSGDWKTAWEGIKSILSGVWDSISGLVKGVVNGIITAINFLIKGANKFKFNIPDWVPGIGGKSFGINIPEIPKFAKGTDYVTQDMLAIIHEGEKITPAKYNPDNPNNQLDKNQGKPVQVNLYLDGKVIAKATVPYIDSDLVLARG